MKCPNCNTEAEEEARFCEECGTDLVMAAAQPGQVQAINPDCCPSCGAGPGFVDADGFCTVCGTMRVRPARDHIETVINSGFAGVTDVGLKHSQNEDYMGMVSGKHGAAIIVCDGTSRSQKPEVGSKAAVDAALAYLENLLKEEIADPIAAAKAAIVAAQEAIVKVPFEKGATDQRGDLLPPAQATIVLAIVQGKRITLSWVGDSRAYWYGDTGATQVSVDDSWLNWVVSQGQMTREEALKSKYAHAIVESLGANSDGTNPGVEPAVRTLNVSESGILLLVSDGFWNYADTEQATGDQVRKILKATNGKPNALTLCSGLVNFARESGGHDNITACAYIIRT